MKHTSWLSGLAAVRSPSAPATARTSSLVVVADREQDPGQAGLVEHVQHVALVLGPVGAAGAAASAPSAPRDDAGVVAGRDGVEAERARPARSSRSNLRWRLHSMHGLGVRPAACAAT